MPCMYNMSQQHWGDQNTHGLQNISSYTNIRSVQTSETLC